MAQAMLKGQRVGVFVDVQNMYYSAKNLFEAKVNFKEILREAIGGRTLIRAIAYVIKADIREERNFFDALEKIGYEVKSKDLQTFAGGAKKGDWDVGIAMDMIELGNKIDVAILVSGDGDYVPLVEHMARAMGCRVEAMAFGRTSSGKLREAVDGFTDLEKQKGKYLIRSRAPYPKASVVKSLHPKVPVVARPVAAKVPVIKISVAKETTNK